MQIESQGRERLPSDWCQSRGQRNTYNVQWNVVLAKKATLNIKSPLKINKIIITTQDKAVDLLLCGKHNQNDLEVTTST